jgi:hypothetical protein
MKISIPLSLLILLMFFGSCSNYYQARQNTNKRKTIAGGTDIKPDERQQEIIPLEDLSDAGHSTEDPIINRKNKKPRVLKRIGDFSKKWIISPVPVSNITASFASSKKKNLTGWEIVLIIVLVILALYLLRLLFIDLVLMIISALIIVALVLLILWLIGQL